MSAFSRTKPAVTGRALNGSRFLEKELAETPTPYLFRFEDNRFTQVEPGKAYRWSRCAIRPGRSPKQMDMSEDNCETWLGIYSIENDILRIACGVEEFRFLAPQDSTPAKPAKPAKPASYRPKSFD